MTCLPIVERELRVASRRWAIYWVRSASGLVAIVLGVFVYLANQPAPAYALGHDLFAALVVLCLLYCLFYGVRSTADCLSGEKREGTLGLLFLTDLKGYDVVLGKMAGSSLAGFYGLLATFPVLAVPLLLGGTTQGEFWREALVLTNTFLLSLSLGIFVSSISRRPRRAMAATFGLMLIFTGLLPTAAGIILALAPTHRSRWAEMLLMPCPFYSLNQAYDFAYRRGMHRFWLSMAILHGLTWLFVLLASWCVRHAWQDKPTENLVQGWRAVWHRWTYGNPQQRQALRTRLLELNPVCWLAGRSRWGPVAVWSVLGISAAFWGWGCVAAGNDWYNEGIYFPTVILLNSVLKLWVASVAGRQFGQDRKDGALELVLGTSLSVKAILRGQLLALARQFLGPLIVIAGLHGIFLAASLQRESFHANPLNPVLWMGGLVVLVSDVVALSWVGMWTALLAKNPNRVTSMTVWRLLAAPWLFLVAFFVVAVNTFPSGSDPHWEFYVGSWFAVSVLTDLGYTLGAWWHLHHDFRQLALQRYALSTPLFRFKRWFKR